MGTSEANISLFKLVPNCSLLKLRHKFLMRLILKKKLILKFNFEIYIADRKATTCI